MLRLGTPREIGDAPGEDSLLFYEPRGVVSVIAPWNFPLAISMGMVSAALVTGNTVVYKPASDTPVTGWMIYQVFHQAGLKPGVLNYLPGPGGEIGDLLVTHQDVSMIAFTGSKEVGLRIIRLSSEVPQGSQGMKRVVAEMGGKNAIVIDSDADLDEAIPNVLHSAFGYQGQKCSACSRLVVLESVHDKLIERLRAAAESIHLGASEQPWTYMGAVISASAQEKIKSYIEVGKQEGTLVLERQPTGTSGFFVPLTIFKDILPDIASRKKRSSVPFCRSSKRRTSTMRSRSRMERNTPLRAECSRGAPRTSPKREDSFVWVISISIEAAQGRS